MYVIRQSLGSLMKDLVKFNFIRIHRSTVINLSFVNEMVYSDYGELDVVVDGKSFRVGQTYRKELQRIMMLE